MAMREPTLDRFAVSWDDSGAVLIRTSALWVDAEPNFEAALGRHPWRLLRLVHSTRKTRVEQSEVWDDSTAPVKD